MKDAPPFEEFLALLLKNQVEFLVCGGVAVGFCGFIRTTEDLDILVRVSEENIARPAQAFAAFGQGYGADITLADFPLEPGCVRVAEEVCPVDVFVLMSGQTYEELAPHAKATYVDALAAPVSHLNRQQLIQLKSDSSSEKDRLDVSALEKLSELPPRG